MLNGNLQVLSTNKAFHQQFQTTPEQSLGRRIYHLGNGQWNIPALRKLLEDILPQQQVLEGYLMEYDFPGLGPHNLMLNAHRIQTELNNTEMILLAITAILDVDVKE